VVVAAIAREKGSLRISRQRKEPLDHPSPRQNGETDLIAAFGDGFDDDAGCGGDTLAGISAVGKSPLDEGEKATRGLLQG
jgi:hypothetical protein